MKIIAVSCLGFVCVGSSAADVPLPLIPTTGSLPQMTVHEKPVSPLGIFVTFKIDGTCDIRLIPPKNGYLTLYAAGARVGDYIVAIDGKAIDSFPRNTWRAALYGTTKVTVARRVGAKTQLLEVECNDEGHEKKKPNPESSVSAKPDTGHLLDKP